MNPMPEVGQPAPDFEGITQTGDKIRLSDFRGQKVVLYFYPKDNTPGCTRQAKSLKEGWEKLQQQGITVIGVSPDSVESHRKFADKHQLPFLLVSDPDHTIAEQYGVWGERNLYGRKFMGIKRTTFLIDEQGIIRKIIKRPDVKNHAHQVLEAWQKLITTST